MEFVLILQTGTYDRLWLDWFIAVDVSVSMLMEATASSFPQVVYIFTNTCSPRPHLPSPVYHTLE